MLSENYEKALIALQTASRDPSDDMFAAQALRRRQRSSVRDGRRAPPHDRRADWRTRKEGKENKARDRSCDHDLVATGMVERPDGAVTGGRQWRSPTDARRSA
jgi:hypothetical protein